MYTLYTDLIYKTYTVTYEANYGLQMYNNGKEAILAYGKKVLRKISLLPIGEAQKVNERSQGEPLKYYCVVFKP